MKPPQNCSQGVTLLELIIAVTILLLLMGAATPVVRLNLKRQKETELRRDLWEMRAAIDMYSILAQNNRFPIEATAGFYPKDFDVLVKGVDLKDVNGNKVRFLRRVPIDPMTGTTDW